CPVPTSSGTSCASSTRVAAGSPRLPSSERRTTRQAPRVASEPDRQRDDREAVQRVQRRDHRSGLPERDQDRLEDEPEHDETDQAHYEPGRAHEEREDQQRDREQAQRVAEAARSEEHTSELQ